MRCRQLYVIIIKVNSIVRSDGESESKSGRVNGDYLVKNYEFLTGVPEDAPEKFK